MDWDAIKRNAIFGSVTIYKVRHTETTAHYLWCLTIKFREQWKEEVMCSIVPQWLVVLARTEVLQSKTNVNVLNKTLKRLQVKENSINFAAEITRLWSKAHDWLTFEQFYKINIFISSKRGASSFRSSPYISGRLTQAPFALSTLADGAFRFHHSQI